MAAYASTPLLDDGTSTNVLNRLADQLAAIVDDPVGTEGLHPLQVVQLLGRLAEATRFQQTRAILAARDHGSTLQAIGDRLGTGRQSVQNRIDRFES